MCVCVSMCVYTHASSLRRCRCKQRNPCYECIAKASANKNIAPNYPKVDMLGSRYISVNFAPPSTLHIRQLWQVHAAAWSPCGEYVAMASADKKIKIFAVQTGVVRRTLTAHTDAVHVSPASMIQMVSDPYSFIVI